MKIPGSKIHFYSPKSTNNPVNDASRNADGSSSTGTTRRTASETPSLFSSHKTMLGLTVARKRSVNALETLSRLTAPQPWGGVTDPRHHDPQSFRYLVHALAPFSKLPSQKAIRNEMANERLEYLLDRDPNLLKEFESSSKNYGDYEISNELFRMPNRINEALSFSTSLIDQNHTETWGDFGYILNVPPENILKAVPRDAGTTNRSFAVHLALQNKSQIPSPERILSESESHNEIWVISSLNQKSISIGGVFYKELSDGRPISPAMTRKIAQQAELLNIPVISIRQSRAPDEIKSVPAGWRIVENDRQIEIQKDDTFPNTMFTPFRIQTSRKQRYFLPEKDFLRIISLLRKTGVPDNELNSAKKLYRSADLNYHMPKLQFIQNSMSSVNNFISKLEKKIGYGEEEQTIHINSNGFGYRANSFDLAEYYGELVVCKEKPSWSPFLQLTPKDLHTLSEEAHRFNPQEANDIDRLISGWRPITPGQLTLDEIMDFVSQTDLH